MSLTSKLTLGAAVTFTVSIVTYVHTSQKREREVSFEVSTSGQRFHNIVTIHTAGRMYRQTTNTAKVTVRICSRSGVCIETNFGRVPCL